MVETTEVLTSGRASAGSGGDGMGVHELSAQLWRERELLELLLFKLEEEQLLLAAGKSRWVSHATREVEQVVQRLQAHELTRAVEVAAVAAEWGIREDAPLTELVAAAEGGVWHDLLESHRVALVSLTDEIARLRDSNQRLLRSALRSAEDAMAGADDPKLYGADGATDPSAGRSMIVDTDL
jgi:hypothetical protein